MRHLRLRASMSPLALAPNKQLERTVIRRRVRAASAPFHYALAARWTARCAAAQLRRYASAMRASVFTGVLLTVLASGDVIADEEVIIADRLDWAGFAAFFVDAPSSIRKRMVRAAEAAAKDGGLRECERHEECAWALVPGTARFFRGVAGSGQALRSGLMCREDIGIPRQRYYARLLLEYSRCIELEWDQEGEEYFFHVPPDA
jgi:hypothetical protein